MTKLRFGIMVNGDELQDWQRAVVIELCDSYLAEPVLVIRNAEKSEPPTLSQKIRSYPYQHFLYRVWKRFFIRVPSMEYQEWPEVMKEVPVLDTSVIKKGKYSEYFQPDDLETIRSYHPDFILRFGFNIIRGEIHQVPKYGVWSYHHGDEMLFRGGPIGFWEIFRGSYLNGVILQRLNDKIDAGVILARRNYQTVFHSYSEHVEKLLSASVDMPLQVCRKIISGDEDIFNQQHSATKAPMNRLPRNFTMKLFLVKLFCYRISFHYKRLMKQEKWDIGIRERGAGNTAWLGIHGKGFYGADPFVFESAGNHYIVYEHYDYSEKKGKINLLKLDKQKNIIQTKIVLESSTHLAYPYIFRHGEKVYMIPETARENEVRLYEWNASEESFSFVHTLIRLPLVDVSVVYHDGKWWLFGGNKTQNPNEKLFVYYADGLTGEYLPHLLNPVKVTPEGARMGGQFVVEDGVLYRYGQYSKQWYGEKLIRWKVSLLTSEMFDEEQDGEIVPQQNWKFHDGLHTFSFTENVEVIDAKKRRSDMVSFKSQLTNKH